MKLTPKQQRFVEEYLIDLNATQAAIRAGYSKKTADVQGPRLLGNVGVAQRIAVAQEERAKRTQIDADWLLQRLHGELNADLADLYSDDGALKPIKEWPLVFRQGLVAGIETEQAYEVVDGKKVPAGVIQKVKLSDRVRREELIGKHVAVGAFAERHEHSGPGGGPIETKLTDDDLAREVAFLFASAIKQQTIQ